MDNKKIYDEAKRRVKIKKDFKEHRNVFIIIMGFLLILNFWTSGRISWVKWPFLGWGLGLFFHWYDTVKQLRNSNDQIQIEKEAEYLKRKHGFSLNKEKNDDIFDMNMEKMKNSKEVMKKE